MLPAIIFGLAFFLVIGSVFPVPTVISSFTIYGYGITHDLWVIGYFLLTYLLIDWFRAREHPYRPAVMIAVGLGVGSELVQLVMPFRVFDMQDIYLNLFGVSLVLFDRRAAGLLRLRTILQRYASSA
ncbi:MAG: VanZ family protein [Candidatus Nanohaloarchaeota archaeon QJJ-5]|nr:VanZ family protein [Candidatus Nanohaloarchaeota archaeon QJJ-5]